jgi:hypothetical protein
MLTLVRQVNLYQAIQELNKEKDHAITKLCALAGVARSAYYKWLKWKPSSMELEIHALAKEIKLRYDKRKGILGYRQMRTQLNRSVITESCAHLGSKRSFEENEQVM